MIETIDNIIPEMAAYSLAFLSDLAEWLTSCSAALTFVTLGILMFISINVKRLVSAR